MNDPSVKILLIESDSEEARLISDLLGRAKRIRFAVERADSLSNGLGRLKGGGIDTILIDVTGSDCDSQFGRQSNPRDRSRCGGGLPVRSGKGSHWCQRRCRGRSGLPDQGRSRARHPGACRALCGRSQASRRRTAAFRGPLPVARGEPAAQRFSQGPRWPSRLRESELSARDRPHVGSIERQDRLRPVPAPSGRKISTG